MIQKYCLLFWLSIATRILSFEQIAPGVLYSHVTKRDPYPLSMHIIEIEKNHAQFFLEHAIGGRLSREPVSAIGKRVDALLAINTGNYRRGGQFNGNAVGFLKLNDLVYADPNLNRSLLWACN